MPRIPTPTHGRETSDEERRARFRQRIARSARAGRPPGEVCSPEDLAWAYAHHPLELEAAEQAAAEARAEEAEYGERRERKAGLVAMTERILAEWDEQRRREAEAEARKRLGWKEDERP